MEEFILSKMLEETQGLTPSNLAMFVVSRKWACQTVQSNIKLFLVKPTNDAYTVLHLEENLLTVVVERVMFE